MKLENIFANTQTSVRSKSANSEKREFIVPSGDTTKETKVATPIKGQTLKSLLPISNALNADKLSINEETICNLTISDFIEAVQHFLNINQNELGISDQDMQSLNQEFSHILDTSPQHLTIGEFFTGTQLNSFFADINSVISFNSIDFDNTATLKNSLQKITKKINFLSRSVQTPNETTLQSFTTNTQPDIKETSTSVLNSPPFSDIEVVFNHNNATENIRKITSENATAIAKAITSSTQSNLNTGMGQNSFSGNSFSSEMTANIIDTISNDHEQMERLSFDSMIKATEDRLSQPTENGRRHIQNAIYNQMLSKFTKEGNKITIELAPRSLGDIEISLENDNGNLRAVVKAENPNTLDILRADRSAIIEILKQNGFDEDKQKISFEDKQENNKRDDNQKSNDNQQRNGQSADNQDDHALTEAKQIIDNDTLDIIT